MNKEETMSTASTAMERLIFRDTSLHLGEIAITPKNTEMRELRGEN